jgi:hypothetical protein
MKKLILLGGCLWAFAAQPAKAQTGQTDIVVMKVLESRVGTRIVVARSWGFPDEIEVKPILTNNEARLMRDSAEKIQEVLTKLYEQGYAIKSSFSGSEGGQSTIVLVKTK